MDKDIIEDIDFYFYQIALAKKRYYELYAISSKDTYRNYNEIAEYVRGLEIYCRALRDKLNEPEIL